MEIQKKIGLAKKNIWQAIDDYRAQTYMTKVLDSIMDRFVDRLAEDSTHAKEELRNLFRRSPVWNEELDALVINGTRTHNPDLRRVQTLADTILHPARLGADMEKREKIRRAVSFFAQLEDDPSLAVQAIESLAPMENWKRIERRAETRFSWSCTFPCFESAMRSWKILVTAGETR